MAETTNTDVIVIGAGPTGLALACQLIRYAVDFVIIDKKPGITPYSKALGVHARTLEIYEQLDLAKKAVAQGTVAGKARMLEKGEILGEVHLENVGQGLSAYPYMLVLEQSNNERLLYEYVKSHGGEVRWETELESFYQDEKGVVAQVKATNSESEPLTGKYLVGCDGPRSLVRHSLGLAFEGSTFERMFYVADVRLDWKFPHDGLHVCIAPHGVVAFFPMPGEKRWRIVGAFPEGYEGTEGEVLYEEIEARIKEETELELDITRVDWFSTYKVHTRHVDKFSKGRGFLAGDSAHIHTPAGGQGMNTGIQDGYNLAWKLAFVLKHSANRNLLDTYDEERLPNARRLTATTDRMFNLAAGNDWFVSLIRSTVFPPMAKYILSIDAIRKRFFMLISQIGINYRDYSLSSHEGEGDFEYKAGDRMPYFLIDGKSIYDRLHAPKFHLLSFVPPDQSGDLSDGKQLLNEIQSGYAEVVDHHVVPLQFDVAELFGTTKAFTVLLRPDNYISFISADRAAQRLAEYLEPLFTR